MSRARKGKTDQVVAHLAEEIVQSDTFRELISQAVGSSQEATVDITAYAVAITQSLGPELRLLGGEILRETESGQLARRPGLSTRTRVGELLGITRQSVDAMFGRRGPGTDSSTTRRPTS